MQERIFSASWFVCDYSFLSQMKLVLKAEKLCLYTYYYESDEYDYPWQPVKGRHLAEVMQTIFLDHDSDKQEITDLLSTNLP